jgi:hypothetical protein
MSLDRDKLARVLALISSSFEHEAFVAARRANEMVKAAGLTWPEVLSDHRADIATEACRRLVAENDELREQIARLKVETAFTPTRWVESYMTAAKIDTCVSYTEWLTGWERGFVTNLARWRVLTQKQSRCLDELITKLRRVACARRLAA